LASAHVLWETGALRSHEAAVFHTKSGVLAATRCDCSIELDLPAAPDTEAELPAGLVEALGVAPRYVGRSRLDYLVQLADESQVVALRPDFARLANVEARGVIVTGRSATPGVDFVSRFFAPRKGLPEDWVTGSAHCCLGPFWRSRLQKDTLVAHQVSARRGVLRVRVTDDRVRLGGEAVTTVRGELLA